MQPKERVTVTMPAEHMRAVERAVAAGAARSVSAFVAESVAARLADDSMDALLADVHAEFGQPTEADRAWVREVLDAARTAVA